jgi:molecular chaperone GrpE
MTKRSFPAGDNELTPGEPRRGPNLLPPADLAAEIERIQEQLRQEHDKHIRALADFTNYRRRQESEGKKLAESGKRELMLPLLDIVDDLERSLERAEEGGEPLAEGVRLIHRKLLALLEMQGVRPFDSKGKIFTPELHEAVAVKKDRRVRPGTIVEELRRGYLWQNELLRPAQVRVAEGGA